METDLSPRHQLSTLIGPDLRRLLLEVTDPEQARELVEEFHPEDLADLLQELESEEVAAILKQLPDDLAAPIFERLEQPAQSTIVAILGPDDAAKVAAEMSSDDRADLIEALPDDVGSQLLETLQKVDPEAAADAVSLRKFDPGTAGGLMTTDYLEVAPTDTVAATIQNIRQRGREAETVYYLFVVDDKRKLLGVASLRDLLLAEPGTRIAEVMASRVIFVRPDTDQEEVGRQMSKYDILAMPVVDQENTLLGVITADDVMDVLTEEGTEDVQKMGGMEAIEAPYFATSFFTLIRARGMWLVILFVEEFFTGTALRHYDEVLSAVSKLAFYVPLLISTGGNSGSQSATLIIRGMAVGEIKTRDWGRIAVRELGMGLVLGAMLAIVGVMRVLTWGDGPRFAVVIALTLMGIVTMGCVVGSMLPIALRRLGFDPATSSTPFIASLVDVLGIVIYFNIAQLILRGMIEQAMAAKAAAGH